MVDPISTFFRIQLARLTLDENATRSLKQMLPDRVTWVDLRDVDFEYEVLTEYDGNGTCQNIEVYFMSFAEVYFEIAKNFQSWANNNSRWKMHCAWKKFRLAPRTHFVLKRDDDPLQLPYEFCLDAYMGRDVNAYYPYMKTY